jgi:hypothetical protein
VREIMALKIEKNSSRGNRTEFGGGRSFIARRRSSPILWFDLKKSGESENSGEWRNVRTCQVRKDAVRRR